MAVFSPSIHTNINEQENGWLMAKITFHCMFDEETFYTPQYTQVHNITLVKVRVAKNILSTFFSLLNKDNVLNVTPCILFTHEYNITCFVCKCVICCFFVSGFFWIYTLPCFFTRLFSKDSKLVVVVVRGNCT